MLAETANGTVGGAKKSSSLWTLHEAKPVRFGDATLEPD